MITSGSHPDVIEMDAASDSGVDDVRDKIDVLVVTRTFDFTKGSKGDRK